MRKLLVVLCAVLTPLLAEAKRMKIMRVDIPVADAESVNRVASAVRSVKPDFAVVICVENTPQENRSAQLAGACEKHVVFGVGQCREGVVGGVAILSEYSFDRSENHRDSCRLSATVTLRNAESLEIAVECGEVAVKPDYRIVSVKPCRTDGCRIIKIKKLKTR